MPEPDRTVFATLLTIHRKRLALTQASLAGRTQTLRDNGDVPRAVTERTINALERARLGEARVPHQATVRSLAVALELEPGTPDYDIFVAAAMDPLMPPVLAAPTEPDAEFIAAGREPQLERLEAAIASAARGVPSVALLTGEAGIGKSRLLNEACRRALDRHDSAVVLWGACPRNFGGMADHEPWREVLAKMLGDPIAAERDLPSANSDHRAARLPLVAQTLTGQAAPLVGRLVAPAALRHPNFLDGLSPGLRQRVEMAAPPSGSPTATPEEVASALIHLLEAYASAGPVILVLEDLHWADPTTLATANRVVAALADHRVPIVLLGSIRTGDGPIDSETSAFVDGVSRAFPGAVIDLTVTVGGDAGRAFVDVALARLELESLANRLFERTGGMPLFVMSFLRLHALDATALTGRNVPDEIGAVFARQLSRLDERARSLLAAASVQGDAFLAEPALAVAGLAGDSWVHWLDETLASHVRFEGSIQAAPGVTMRRYRFTHAVLRDHVMNGLSHLERSHLHLASADALDRTLGARHHDLIDQIASHLEQGGDFGRAAIGWLAAGDRAMLRSDHHHAREIYRHIKEMGVGSVAPDVHVQALVGIGNCHRALGRPFEARQALQRARREAIRKQLHTIDANALTSLGVLDFDEGRMVTGAARFAEAIEAYTRAGNLEEASRGNGNLSLALHGMGRYDDARVRATEAIALAEEAGSATALASGRIALSNVWLDLGYYERAIERYEDGLAYNDAHDLTHYGNICLLNIALCEIELGRWNEAEATLARLDDPERRLVDRMRSVVAFNRALVGEGRGDHETARRNYDASRVIRQRLGQGPLLIDSLAGLLRTAVATGATSDIVDLIAELEDRLAGQGTIGIEHLGRLYLAMFDGHRATGDEARATTWLLDAVAMLRERADRLSDPAHRESYLTRPTAHARIIGLARRRGLSVPDSTPPPA